MYSEMKTTYLGERQPEQMRVVAEEVVCVRVPYSVRSVERRFHCAAYEATGALAASRAVRELLVCGTDC